MQPGRGSQPFTQGLQKTETDMPTSPKSAQVDFQSSFCDGSETPGKTPTEVARTVLTGPADCRGSDKRQNVDCAAIIPIYCRATTYTFAPSDPAVVPVAEMQTMGTLAQHLGKWMDPVSPKFLPGGHSLAPFPT